MGREPAPRYVEDPWIEDPWTSDDSARQTRLRRRESTHRKYVRIRSEIEDRGRAHWRELCRLDDWVRTWAPGQVGR